MTWVLWSRRHRNHVHIHVYSNMHIHACLHVLTYSRRFILWNGTVIIRFRVLPSGSSLVARVFNPLLLLFIIEPLSTHVLRDQCRLHMRSRIGSEKRLRRSRAHSKGEPLRSGWLVAQDHLNISSQASSLPPRLLNWFPRKYLRLGPPDTVAAGREVMHQPQPLHHHHHHQPPPRRRP